ncbi:MAG: thymidine kinase [Bacteroidota bacterium]
MFIENLPENSQSGWIEVITGAMFSGKTEELIRRLRRAKIAAQRVIIFKPYIDKRYSLSEVVSHDAQTIPSTPVHRPEEILKLSEKISVIGIDEAQFFDTTIIDVCNELANKGCRVIAAGLDMDYMGRPFSQVASLAAMAEYVTKLHAICMKCGSLAHFSHRKANSPELVLIGEKEHYEPLCRKCYNREKKTHDNQV